MKLTNFSANAYKKTASENSADSEQSAASQILSQRIGDEKKAVKTPVFEKISKEDLLKNKSEPEFKPFVPKTLVKTETAVKQEQVPAVSESPAASIALSQGGLLKVPVQPKEKDGRDSVYRRVAKFLMIIGIDEAARVLQHLTPEQTEKIVPELATIRYVNSKEAETILNEFKSLITQAREDGGVNTARNILEKAFGTEKASEVLEKSVPFKNGKPFNYLAEADGTKISALLKNESSAVRALVCSNLEPKVAAAFISQLPENEKKDVILRLAKLKDMDPVIIAKIDEAMQKKFNSLVTERSDEIDGKSILAHILKKMDSSAEEKILNQLSQGDPELGSELREKLFTLEDIINADDRFIENKLRNMEDEEIAYLIAHKEDAFREKILSNVSSNRKTMILDEEERRMPMRRQDIEMATSRFFSYMRRAWEDGKLIIKGRDDEIYV